VRPASAQELRSTIESHVDAHQKDILAELWEALHIPSVAADTSNIRRKAELLERSLEKRGFEAELLETDGNPLVFGELWRGDSDTNTESTRTLLLYCHYDGQPVDPSKWKQPDPFQPVLMSGKVDEGATVLDFEAQTSFDPEWRIYARSASDDTAPIFGLLAAVDALESSGIDRTSTIKVIFDGEEEAGSPSLVPAIEKYRDRLGADLMLILDGPLHQSGQPTIVYGARGIVTMELTVYGPKFPLHSGHYGNWAPNPAMRISQLLSSMKDRDGRVIVDGFYDGIEVSEAERAVLASVPDDLEELKRFLGFSEPDRVGDSLQEAIQFPSLNVRGLSSGWVGAEARTIVPDRAVAAIDVRLVKETDADAMFEKVLAHVRAQGYHVVTDEPDDEVRARHGRLVKVVRSAGSNAYRTELDEPATRPVVNALTEIWGASPVRKRTSGGTVPIAPFVRALSVPALNVPTVNFDNNQHSPNENLRLGHFFRSIVSFAAILTM
jgi:acetylornithine deacetylase/succinyl-diaminopimelate desuccinylase-like protein